MKTTRLFLAAALIAFAAACSTDVTAPAPAAVDPSFDTSATSTAATNPDPTNTEVEVPKEDDGGLIGSSGGGR